MKLNFNFVVLFSIVSVQGVSALVNSFFCDEYSASNTNSTLQNSVVCIIPNVIPGTILQISDCSKNSCKGDQYIRLFDDNDREVESNDDGDCKSPLGMVFLYNLKLL